MVRDKALAITIFALILTSLACNAFAGNLEPLPPPPTAAVQERAGGDLAGPAATVTLPALSALSTGTVTVLVDLNIRSGPGVQYDRVGFLLKDDVVPVLGVHSQTGWWKIECPAIASGSECWLSGGEQYTRAENVSEVAEVLPPATPTPIPPTLEEGLGLLVFIDDGALFAVKLDLTQDLLQPVGDKIQLTELANVQRFAVSPDGRRVAFISGSAEGNSLNVVNTDGQDQRTLLISSDLPIDGGQSAADLAVLVDQISWLPDSTAVAFNTVQNSLVGPGIGSQEDLWTVTLDQKLSQPFPEKTGGGAFAVLSNGKVLLSRADNIARADLDGSNIELVLEFESVNTASEYVYYPIPQQIGEGQARLSIPDAEPWQPGAWTTLWQLPVSGLAGQLGSIDGVLLNSPILWSPGGSRLAFIQQTNDLDSAEVSRLVIADGTGINSDPYAGGELLTVHAWASDEAFLYSGKGFYAVGRVNAPPIQTLLEPGQQVNKAQWITEDNFVIAVGFPENSSWEMISTTPGGEKISLGSLRGFNADFEVWRP